MLEGLVAWVLNNYLGKYVQNLNTDQLSIALLSGEVELENLPLKKDALRNFNIPIEVKAGFIGKIKLQIPVRQIRSAPWVIVIERLYLVASPINLNEWDNEVEENIAVEQKLNLLDSLEAQWRADHEAQFDSSYYATSYSSWLSYGTGLLTNIIENIQLRIKDVHLRYEDLITCSERNAFSCGLSVESLSAESCDANWQRGFTISYNEFDGCSFKLVELQKLAFYWDTITIPVGIYTNYTFSELSTRMAQSWLAKHDYILAPSNAKACLRREKCEQPLRSKTRPRITCHLTLEEVALNIIDKQYNEMVGCIRGLNLIGQLRVFRRQRPRIPVLADVRAWWKYAVKCLFPEHTWMDPQPTWESCLAQARLVTQYVSICSSLLAAPAITLSPEKKLIKDRVEWTIPFLQLKLMREAAMRNLPKKMPHTTIKSSSGSKSAHSLLLRWFPQWWGWYGTTTTREHSAIQTDNSSAVAPVELEEEILDALADTEENNTILKRDTVFGQFDFTLIKGNLVLSTSIKEINPSEEITEDTSPKPMLNLQFENLCFGVESRPRTNSHIFSIALGTVCLHDYITLNTLFPVLIAPQGTIRENLGGVRYGTGVTSWNKSFQLNNAFSTQTNNTEPLFQLTYERKPALANYRLYVKSRSLEVVYNSGIVKWLSDFVSYPFSFNCGNGLVASAPIDGAYTHVKHTTKMHLMNQWEHLIQGNLAERSSWQIELDISAPQILLVEKFTDRNGVVALVDFGKMYLSNMDKIETTVEVSNDDDSEMFMTPCSTPPGSEISESNLTSLPASPLPTDVSQPNATQSLNAHNQPGLLNHDSFHHKLYDRYKIELSELQILVGRAKDNWKYAHTKGTSALHILDKFNILLQAERRIIYTSDPQFPSATICGTLPFLVVHLNEHKLKAVHSLLAEIRTPACSPISRSFEDTVEVEWKISPPPEEPFSEQTDTEQSDKSSNQLSTLFMLQFSVDQMALEVQSRGRSIAELQVCGVKLACTMRPFDYNISLSVHSLLLVDALQTYGPDFELLVASHKHVGMDSVSGSMLDSEPTSPTSPASPDGRATSPQPAILTNAVHSLTVGNNRNPSKIVKIAQQCTSPVIGPPSNSAAIDSEALIIVDVTVINANCPTNQGEEMRIANILFNNLDIIANQETIVELIGFAQRVFVPMSSFPKRPSDVLLKELPNQSSSSIFNVPNDKDYNCTTRTEITFDFHRLSVLLLRAIVQEGNMIGKKIATATMCEAKIQATLADDSIEVKGSLGGLQVVSLCPGTIHQRVLSIGHDLLLRPLCNQTNVNLVSALSQEIYRGSYVEFETSDEEKAFIFNITRSTEQQIYQPPNSNEDEFHESVNANISIHMASVWYTHSGSFLGEVQSCVTEFKQYLSNLAKSIKVAATDMAYGFVQPRESLYSNPKISVSNDGVSVRRPRASSFGHSLDLELSSECIKSLVKLSVDIDLETPVVVLPRSPTSTSVFVAHLGHMSVSNKIKQGHNYDIQIRDINLYSVDISSRLHNSSGLTIETMQLLYGSGPEGKPILHDTTMQLTIESMDIYDEINKTCKTNIQFKGKIVTPLKVSATREQYEQLLDTVNMLSMKSTDLHIPKETQPTVVVSDEDPTGVITLNLDPKLRANFTAPPTAVADNDVHFKVDFQLPQFTVELKGDFGNGERSLVDLSFRDFIINYDKCSKYETNILVSLHSITMEDLSRDFNSKHRLMMVSHMPHLPKAVFVSRSCPDFFSSNLINTQFISNRVPVSRQGMLNTHSCSLPGYLHEMNEFEGTNMNSEPVCGTTPPPSPQYKHKNISDGPGSVFSPENLVLISWQLRDPSHPHFHDKYNDIQKLLKIELNCLNLIVSMDSWVVVLDFFGIDSHNNIDSRVQEATEGIQEATEDVKKIPAQLNIVPSGNIETKVVVRSLSIILLDQKGEVCEANISRFGIKIWEDSTHLNRSVHGSLGSMSLIDLTKHGKIWRERFMTSGKEALNFHYKRLSSEESAIAACDTTLRIEMSSIIYVHTKRFVMELQTFFRKFSQLQSVLTQARQKVSITSTSSKSNKMHLSIESASPLILVPVSSASTSVLVIDLGLLKADNSFKIAGSRGTISTIRNTEDPARELLDVMVIQLEHMDLYCGERCTDMKKQQTHDVLPLGSVAYVKKWGPSLLTKKCHLLLQVEKNMEEIHNVPDMTIHGTLNTLESAIDPSQYKLIRGLLSFNLGENVNDLYVDSHDTIISSVNSNINDKVTDKVWTLTSIKLDLLNVILRLETKHKVSSLACIHFIKSCLVVETFSDLTQDTDLVSQEILVSDTRYQSDPVNKRSNVFTNIVQPIEDTCDLLGKHSVQAEFHTRKRQDHSAYTFLVNNMRLMAIFDWWDSVKEFIMQPPTSSENNQNLGDFADSKIGTTQAEKQWTSDQTQFELKLNITESQIVVVEDTSLLDSNAVILKSTTVISYHPGSEFKPISCVLNHCEVFSCVIGMEDETALSIIDPVTLQIDLNASNDLQFQVAVFNIRLSYHDMRMFAAMLKSLPEQARGAVSNNENGTKVDTCTANSRIGLSMMQPLDNWSHDAVNRLSALGFNNADCSLALEASNGRVDEAALWLTQHATTSLAHIHSTARLSSSSDSSNGQHSELWPLRSIQLKAECISICVIDDCRDSDVPLLELSLTNLTVNQSLDQQANLDDPSISSLKSPTLHPVTPSFEIPVITDKMSVPGQGKLCCIFSADYFNRELSGWEPAVEPWRCDASWEYALTSDLNKNRLQIEIKSAQVLNFNITSTLMDLYNLVKTNWTQDYYSMPVRTDQSPKTSPSGYRRRSPFVPFALKNQTGCRLSFITIVTSGDIDSVRARKIDDEYAVWRSVPPDESIPLSFSELEGGRRSRRGVRNRGACVHQIAVRIDNWGIIGPVCVDRVGTFFRIAAHAGNQVEAKVVFEVKLEGSARKMITVRSALQIVNMLPNNVELRTGNSSDLNTYVRTTGTNGSSRAIQLQVGETWCIPLSHNPTPLCVRPLVGSGNLGNMRPGSTSQALFYFSDPLDWRFAARKSLTEATIILPNVCLSSRDEVYRFCCILKREKYPLEKGLPQAGHTFILKPPLRIVNLLPVELHYSINSTLLGTILPGIISPFHNVDVENPVEISLNTDGFVNTSILTILPTVTTSFSVKVKLTDTKGRRLYLNAHISIKRSDTVKVLISAPYWIVNRTGFPIIFKQEGIANETAGQFEEHEIARMVAPLLFSFAETDGSPTVVARIGSIIQGQSQWCSSFSLAASIVSRRLVVKGATGLDGGGGGGERVFFVGIVVRPGRGRYRHTNICTISPHYQIHNNTSYYLQFAQKCFAATFADPAAEATQMSAVTGSCLAWHWPRVDRDQFMCVRLLDVPNCRWSGGFRVDVDRSLHINCRDSTGVCHFLRLEVVLQGATFFVVFTDAETMPPPIRIDNYAPISLKFLQSACEEETTIKANSSMPWALLEPCSPPVLIIEAPGGSRISVDLQKLGETQSLVYQNFIYLAFTGTHQPTNSTLDMVENSQLVLEASQSGQVFLAQQRHSDRAQLWKWSRGGQLYHEGSYAPLPSRAVASKDALVLDTEEIALRTDNDLPLAVRRTNPTRECTQTWQCTPDGRLRCQYTTLAVQPKDGFFGLRPGSRAVLALTTSPSTHLLPSGIPIEQAVSMKTLRPGSGNLKVTVMNDGPTRVIKITDAEDQTEKWCVSVFDRSVPKSGREIQLKVNIGGLGVSFVSRSPMEELLYAEFRSILMEVGWSPKARSINLSVQDIQCDNQLLGTSCPVVIFMPRSRSSSATSGGLPALQLSLDVAPPPPSRGYRVTVCRHAILSLHPVAVRLDERLLLALCAWLNIGTTGESSSEGLDEMEENTQRMLTEATAAHAQRYYFEVLKLVPSQIILSVQTVSKLPPSLAIIKKRLGLTLINFEDAGVDLEQFVRWHPFESSQFLWQSIIKHFTDELKWQAATILGSVDFLGNPVGFMQDVSDGVSELIFQGNISALVKNVTHGLSNSAAKVTESLGDGLGRVILDEEHEETRRKIRSGGDGGHIYTGLKGLYLGILGGFTSLAKQSYEGASQEGLKGFFVGVGKGVVGTVTKPVLGVLDLAAETASALRETSRRSDHWIPERMRPPRLVSGPGGLLPRYSRMQSHGQQYLYAINGDDRAESLIAYDTIRSKPYDIRALVSTRHVRIFTVTTGSPHIILETDIANLIACQAVTSRNEHYVELMTSPDTSNVGNLSVPGNSLFGGSVRRPQVQCDTEDLSVWLAHQVNYAKQMYHESLHTLPSENEDE